jgi:hypothetical protein
MYSTLIVERRLAQARKAGSVLNPLPVEDSIDIARRIEKLRMGVNGQQLPEGTLIRPLDDKERAFVESERTICKADFRYYAERYHHLTRDPGVGEDSGIGPASFLPSQERHWREIGKREEACYEEKRVHGLTEGILIYAHKIRQVAVTDFYRRITMHRMTFWPGTRALAAALQEGEEGTGELYKRDQIALAGMPFWMRPGSGDIVSAVKNESLGFGAPWNSNIAYRAETGRQGLGTGTQIDVSHLTEVPLWTNPGYIRFSFKPSLPKAVSTFHVQEGTSSGKGNYWHEVSEACRWRKEGYESWLYIFLPWWINTLKYRKPTPTNWVPEKITQLHAEMVERTSPEFNEGVTCRLSREQMYWWQTERAAHADNGELATFLANYGATPEQTFTNFSAGALPIELIDEMELDERRPMPYELRLAMG